jgi:transcriptional regulator with XRE-family HTH domain
VASDAGISLPAYQRAERGGPVWQLTVQKIARALLVEPEELLEVDEGVPEESGASQDEKSKTAERPAPHRMRKLRQSQLKSQQQVAAEAGIDLYTYQRAEAGDRVSQRTVQKIAQALRVEPEELLEVYEGKLKGSDSPKYQRSRSGNLATLQASNKKTKHHLIKLARVYGLHHDAAPDTLKHKQFLQRSEEASDVLRAAGFHSWEISAAYDFLLETGPAGLRALLGDWRGTPDPKLIRSFADTLFELAEQGRVDLSTAIARIDLVRVAFAL